MYTYVYTHIYIYTHMCMPILADFTINLTVDSEPVIEQHCIKVSPQSALRPTFSLGPGGRMGGGQWANRKLGATPNRKLEP